MILPSLDVPTVFVVAAVVVGSSGCLLILARGRHASATPLVLWASAMLVGAAGIVMLGLAPFVAWPSRMAGNVAILTGTGLSWSGARMFAGRRVNLPLMAAGPAAWLCADLAIPDPASNAPAIIAFLTGASYTAATAFELWRIRAERLPSATAAVVLSLVFEALLHTMWLAFLFLALMRDRAELSSTEQLRAMTVHDELTGLGNRRQFDALIVHEVQRARRERTSIALLMIDVDRFKPFNDTYGHPAGDDALRRFATAIGSACSRPGDQAMRYGGEEFAVLLPGVDGRGAGIVARQIRLNVKGLQIAHRASEHGLVTVSIGMASGFPAAGVTAGELLGAADQALYAAKASGRDAATSAGTLSQPAAPSGSAG